MALSSATVPHISARTRRRSWTERWALWIRRYRTRKELRELDARQLGDVAITVSERSAECAKWFWQA